MFIDSHAHLTCDAVYPQVDVYIQAAKNVGLEAICNICTDPMTLERGIELKKKYPDFIYNIAATTPHDVEKEGEAVFPVVEKAAKEGLLVAIGETGLDYYYTHSNPAIQQDFLRRYLRLARQLALPVVIHCRDAFSDFFTILDEEYKENGNWLPGVLHCFTGTKKEAEEVIKRGWMLSLSGIVTFKKSEELREVAQLVPLNQLLIETDTPYLAPQKYRGKPNQPSYLVETAALIAQIKGLTADELGSIASKNSKKLFKL